MEFKITKEQIDELAKTGNHYTERYLQSIFPEAFKKELETGKWYKINNTGKQVNSDARTGDIVLILSTNKDEIKQLPEFKRHRCTSLIYAYQCIGYNQKGEVIIFGNHTPEFYLTPATEEEISAALIAEAEKRGYKKGQIIKSFIVGKTRIGSDSNYEWKYFAEENALSYAGAWVFKSGRWAEILPTEKTVITREKALKILAKKLKVSPDNIEIE